jgi:hypothetical protein
MTHRRFERRAMVQICKTASAEGGYPLLRFWIWGAGVSFKRDFLLVQIQFILSQIVTGWHPVADDFMIQEIWDLQ